MLSRLKVKTQALKYSHKRVKEYNDLYMCENCENPTRCYQILLTSEWENGVLSFHRCPHCLERVSLSIQYKEPVKFNFVYLGKDQQYKLFKESPLSPRMSDESFLKLMKLIESNNDLKTFKRNIKMIQSDIETPINLEKIKTDKRLSE